jgi:hypothetical protein
VAKNQPQDDDDGDRDSDQPQQQRAHLSNPDVVSVMLLRAASFRRRLAVGGKLLPSRAKERTAACAASPPRYFFRC